MRHCRKNTMNLPNKLTLFRVVLIIPFVIFLLIPNFGYAGRMIALAIFIVASLTDFFDGKIARKHNLVTDFGKFMDPLADKLLVCSALICFVEKNEIASWIVIIIIAREFIISGFRLVASNKGVVIAASYWGKYKTAFQMFAIIFLIIDLWWIIPFYVITQILVYVALVLTIVSLIDYLVKNWNVIGHDM